MVDNTNEQNYLVANMDTFIGINTSKEEKWLAHWNCSCDIMAEKYEEINANQPVVTRKATKEEIAKWSSIKKNPFKLGD